MNNWKNWLSIPMLIITLLLSGCQTPTTTTIIAPKAIDATVVTTSVALTQILTSLGVPVAGVPTTSYDLPAAVSTAVEVGNPMSPDLEIIKALQPSVVVTLDTLGSDYLALFTEANVPTEVVSLESVEDLFATITRLGELFAVETTAQALVSELQTQIQAIQLQAQQGEQRDVLVVFAAPGATLFATETSYIGSLVALAGGNNLITETASYVAVNKEYIASLNPDQIVVMTHALPEETKAALTAEMATDPMWQALHAVQNGNVVYLDPTIFGMSADLALPTALQTLQALFSQGVN